DPPCRSYSRFKSWHWAQAQKRSRSPSKSRKTHQGRHPMRLKGRFRLSFTNVLVTVALFAALAGTSYAAVRISGKNIKSNSVTGSDIRNGSLAKKDFGKGLFESAKAAPLSSAAFEADRSSGPANVSPGDYVTVATLNV